MLYRDFDSCCSARPCNSESDAQHQKTVDIGLVFQLAYGYRVENLCENSPYDIVNRCLFDKFDQENYNFNVKHFYEQCKRIASIPEEELMALATEKWNEEKRFYIKTKKKRTMEILESMPKSVVKAWLEIDSDEE